MCTSLDTWNEPEYQPRHRYEGEVVEELTERELRAMDFEQLRDVAQEVGVRIPPRFAIDVPKAKRWMVLAILDAEEID